MIKIALIGVLIVLASSTYDNVLGEKLCRLAVASYCKKAEV